MSHTVTTPVGCSRYRALAVVWLLSSTVANAATPSGSDAFFSGFVTEPSGVNGIDGAVVSVEWHIVPSKAARASIGAPTVLAVWQGRTDKKGAFRIAAESLVLPAGMAPAPDAFPRLQVFAVNHKPYRVSGLGQRVAIGKDGYISIKWPDEVSTLRLIYQRETPEDLNAQFDSWSRELDRATRKEVWPRGEKQARESYSPLLSLLSESCYGYRIYFGASLPACERAKVSLALKEPAPQWREVPPTPATDPPSPPVTPVAIITPSDPPRPSLGSMRQEPPEP